ncbi:MAG: hypothetical protein AB7K64_12430 [Variibacter sp.]
MSSAIIPALPGFSMIGFDEHGAIERVPIVAWDIADHGVGQLTPIPIALRHTDIIGFALPVLAPDGTVSECDGERRTWRSVSAFSRSARAIRRK